MENKRISELEISEKTLPVIEQIANSMPGGFFIYHADGEEELIYFNNAMLDIFGCENEEQFREITKNSFRGIVHPLDLDAVEESITSQINNSDNKDLDYVEYRIIRRDGDIRYVVDYGHFVRTRDYGNVYYVFIDDATDKRLKLELERQRRINKLKTDFLFNISHDIRTPMNAIMGFTALAMSNIDDKALLVDYLEKVNVSNRQMMTLIDDLIEMSTIESGNLRLSCNECSVPEMIGYAVEMTELSAKDNNIEITTNIGIKDEIVCADKSRLLRVIMNIMNNAIKFTPYGGSISVTVSETEVSSSGYARYEISIADTGVGMSKEFMNRIFQPFEREKTSTKSGNHGTGLGLSIAKSLLDIMGGSISVESEKGRGSTFTVSVPLKLVDKVSAPPRASHVEAISEKTGTGKRVLIVEDIELNRILAETVLRKYGYIVDSVTDGCDAVDTIREHEPYYYDLVLMDVQMPVMNGYEATRAIRSIGRDDTAVLPIVALSANASPDDRQMSLSSGMNDHIAKPFDIAHLINTIKNNIKDCGA